MELKRALIVSLIFSTCSLAIVSHASASHCDDLLLSPEQEVQIKKMLDQDLAQPEFQSALHGFVYEVVLNSKIRGTLSPKDMPPPEALSSFIRFLDLPILRPIANKTKGISKKYEAAGTFIAEMKRLQEEVLAADDKETLGEYFIKNDLLNSEDRDSFLFWIEFFGTDQSSVTAALLIDDFLSSQKLSNDATRVMKILKSDSKLAAKELLESHQRLLEQKLSINIKNSIIKHETNLALERKATDKLMHDQRLALNSTGMDSAGFREITNKFKLIQKWDHLYARSPSTTLRFFKRAGTYLTAGLTGYLAGHFLAPHGLAPMTSFLTMAFTSIPFELGYMDESRERSKLRDAMENVLADASPRTIHDMNLKQLAEFKELLLKFQHHKDLVHVTTGPYSGRVDPEKNKLTVALKLITDRQAHLREVKAQLSESLSLTP